MKLLTALLLLTCVSVFGANPDYKSFRGTGGILITSNPPNGNITIDGSSVMPSSGTNATISTSTNGTKIAVASTNVNFVEGNNIYLRGTNIASRSDIQINLKSNLTFQNDSGPMLLGSAGSFFGFSNYTTGVWSLWLDETDISDVWHFGDDLTVQGNLTASNATLTTLLGSGAYLAVAPSGILYRTNNSAQPPTTTLTNLSANPNKDYTNIFLTTNCFVTAGLNTNVLIATGAGTAGANGTYAWNSGAGRYEKSTFNITYNGGDAFYYLSNGASQLYGNAVSPTGPWTDVLAGSSPAPTVVYGPITNCFVTVSGGSYNFAMPNQNTNTLWVDSTFGNDTNAIRANPYFPFKTIQSAVDAAHSGDTIKISRGLHTYSTLTSINGLTFVGEGKGLTILGAASASSTIFNLASTNVVANLTINGHVYLGNSGPGTTNSRIYNCEIFGTTDGILLTKWYDFRIEDSYIESPYDCFADFATNGTSVAIIKNCYIWSHNNGAGFSRGISGGCNRIEVYGGAVRSDYGNAQNACVYYDPELTKTNAIGSVLLSGVALIATNTATLHVYSSNMPITIIGGIVNSNRLAGNGTFNFQGNILDNLTVKTNVLVKGQIYAPSMSGSGAFVGWDATAGQLFKTNAPAGGGSGGISGIIAGNSNQIPYLDHTGTNYTYGAGSASTLTNAGFGFRPSGPNGGYGGLEVYANTPMGLLTIGHPNPASDFATDVAALVVSNRFNSAADFPSHSIKFETVLIGGGLSATSTLTRWRVWNGSASSNDVAFINLTGRLSTTAIQMTNGAARNQSLRSDDEGNGNWGSAPAGGNGNGPNNFAPAGGIQFAQTNVAEQRMVLDSTNIFYYDRSSYKLHTASGGLYDMWLTPTSLVQAAEFIDLTFGVYGVGGGGGPRVAWNIKTSSGNLVPALTNSQDIGAFDLPTKTNYANQLSAKVGVDVGYGSGTNGSWTPFDMSGTKFSRLEAPGAVINTNTHRLWMSTNAGVVAEYTTIAGINQLTNVPITAGQYVTVDNNGYPIATNGPVRQGLYRTIYVDAAAMVSNITAGATFNTEESIGAAETTNKMVDSYIFDGSTSNSVQFKLAMPLEWDLGTVKVKLWTWSTNNVATTTNVFDVAAFAAKDATVLTNTTYGTPVKLTNVVSSGGGKVNLTPPTTSLTVGNTPASGGNLVWFRVRRLPGNADDNDSGQTKLLGAWIQYKETTTEVSSW